jgi:glucose/arabinose dehydrogenase
MRRGFVLVLAGILTCALPGTLNARLPRGLDVKVYKTGLKFAIDMAWAKGTHKVFFTEKTTGKIRVMKGRRLLRRPCRNLDVNGRGERGALGITLHPNFDKNHWLYVFYVNAHPLENRVTRFKVEHNRCRHKKNILTNIDASSSGYHNGGQLEFVKGKLFVSTGEAHDPAEAQNRHNRLGKILRVNPDGTVPNSNPFGNSDPVWSFGHRNPFGLTHDPRSGRIYETENGPSCDDELNQIRKGRNYGWGSGYQCGTRGVGPNPKGPMRRWRRIIVPTDPVFYHGRLGRLSNRLFVGDYNSGRLHRFVLNRRGTDVKRHSIIHNSTHIVDVSKGPGGWLYFMTPSTIYVIRR